MKTMRNDIIFSVIEEAHQRFGDPTYDQYREVAFELFPSDMEALASSFSRQGFVKWLRDGMRRVVNLDEQDLNAPRVQLDLLPGGGVPAFLNLGTDTAPKLRRFVDCTVDDLDVAIETRKRVYARVGARIEDLLIKRDWLHAYRKDPRDTVGEILERSAPVRMPAQSQAEDRASL
jgi:hypothetical protein